MKYKDHRQIGRDLNLFFFDSKIGAGLPVYTERGTSIRSSIIKYIEKMHLAKGYSFISTPHIGTKDLFRRSGHLKWYGDSIYPVMTTDEGEQYFLKPMNCPFHAMTYSNQLRSYRELPIKLFEFGTIYRYEASGGLYGLNRVRSITQDDSHIFCRDDSINEMVHEVLDMIFQLLKVFDLKVNYIELSTYNKGKIIEDKDRWDQCIERLKEAIISYGIKDFKYDNEGAAFYGPKISVQIEDKNKKTWQLSTVQLDLEMSGNFDLSFKDRDGSKKRPIVIHRAILGSLERFIGLVLENSQGLLPSWLAPVQLAIIPISSSDMEYTTELIDDIRKKNIRHVIYDRDFSFNKKLNRAYLNQIPYIAIAGKKNRENRTLSVIERHTGTQSEMDYNGAIELLRKNTEIPKTL